MAHIYSIDGVRPVIHPSSFIHPSASIIGQVVIGRHCYIGPHASLRGDYGEIRLADGVNFQDGCVAHGFPEGLTEVQENGHISHGAVLHGCVIERDCMIGIQAVIMDRARIGAESMVAALSYVRPGTEVPPRSIVAGSPAEIKRAVKDEEMHWKKQGTAIYQQLTRRCLESFKACEPLREETQQNAQLKVDSFKPLK